MTDILTTPLADELGEIAALKAELSKREAKIKAILKPALSNGQAAEGTLFRVTLSDMERKTLDKKAVQKLLSGPKFAACLKIGYSLRFNVNPLKVSS